MINNEIKHTHTHSNADVGVNESRHYMQQVMTKTQPHMHTNNEVRRH